MIRIFPIVVFTLLFSGCMGSKIHTCSDDFNNCPKPTELESCNFSFSKYSQLRGPLDTLEVQDFLEKLGKQDSLAVDDFRKNSELSDSFYWYKIGSEKGRGYRSGNTGLISIKECLITADLMLAVWVYGDIAMLENN